MLVLHTARKYLWIQAFLGAAAEVSTSSEQRCLWVQYFGTVGSIRSRVVLLETRPPNQGFLDSKCLTPHGKGLTLDAILSNS